MNVLGTPVRVARDDDRPRTFLLSDLHLGAGTERVFEALERVLVSAAEHAPSTRVLILGDLFDVWVNSGQMRIAPWDRAVELLRRTTQHGVSCSVLHGNRDYMLGPRFATRTGCTVVDGGLSLRLGDRKVLALHGDELCQNDVDYQRVKRMLRHPVTRAVLASIPTRFALRLGDRARAKSKASIARQPDPTRFEPTRAAVDAAFATGAELLVFGHIHRSARGRLDGGPEYCVLPAFDEAGIHLRHDERGLGFYVPDGRRIEDPAPRAFA